MNFNKNDNSKVSKEFTLSKFSSIYIKNQKKFKIFNHIFNQKYFI